MSVAFQLTRTCTIKTAGSPASNDAEGQAVQGADVTVTGVMCRYGDLSRTEIVNLQAAGFENLAGYLLVGRSTAITLRARVSAITNRNGEVEQAGPFEVVQITERRNGMAVFKSCVLSRIKPADNA